MPSAGDCIIYDMLRYIPAPIKYLRSSCCLHIRRNYSAGPSSLPNQDKLREIIAASKLRSEDINEKPKHQSTTTYKDFTKTDKGMNDQVPPSVSLAEKIKAELKTTIDNLPSQKEEIRSTIFKKFDKYMDSLQYTILKATRALNDVTGYSSIEKLRSSIETLEVDLKQAKENVKSCKQAYTEAIAQRSQLQKEVNELLTRKHDWSPQDLERFTELYRNDLVNEQNEVSTQQKLNEAEQLVDAIQLKLTQLILTRYHEEQIWSDKIRRASTWGTWGLMGFNIMLFFMATFIVEPWKRRRMVDAFEEKVKLAINDLSSVQSGKMDKIITNQEKQTTRHSDTYSFNLALDSWNSFKASIVNGYQTITSPTTQFIQFQKNELSLLLTFTTIFTGAVASFLTLYFT